MLVAALRFAIAIVLNAGAFIVWDIGTRPPMRLIADVRAAASEPRRLARGLVRLLIGAALLIAAAFVARPAIHARTVFSILETGMIVAGLVVEALVGPDLRARLRGGQMSR